MKRGNKILKEYLVLWKGYPVEDAMWAQTNQFSYTNQLQGFLKEDQPQEEKVKWWGHHFFEGGSSCGDFLLSCICVHVPMSLRAKDLCTRWMVGSKRQLKSTKICGDDTADWVPLGMSVFGLWYDVVSCWFTNSVIHWLVTLASAAIGCVCRGLLTLRLTIFLICVGVWLLLCCDLQQTCTVL